MGIRGSLKTMAVGFLASKGFVRISTDNLTDLADNCGSDKGTRLDAHGYTRIYKGFFEQMRGTALTFLEIGLARPDDDHRRVSNAAEGITTATASRAPSLEMWRTYFPRAQIFGFDIDDFTSANVDGCTILQGDMSSEQDLKRLVDAIGNPIDILIEDGSHLSHHQQFALGWLFPHVRSGGIYVIEDLHWQEQKMERHNAPKTRDVLRRLQMDGVFESPFLTQGQQKYIQDHVAKLWLFDSLTPRVEDPSGALGILIKK
jgi:hypothetical protein